MIQFTQVRLAYGARSLIEDLTLSLHAGWRVGITGRNGTGKSSLLRLILGELTPDGGELQIQRGIQIARVAQETPALPDSALDFALDGDVELRALEAQLRIAEDAHDAERIGALHERLAAIGGYAARARAAQLLRGLGFDPQAQERAVADFSGGWRMRLNLARALMQRSDLLLLDEPTNHLDLDAVLWLQDYLARYPGMLLLISHDREFLDAVTTHTLHVEQQGATLYTGGYSQFERTRAERLALQTANRDKQLRYAAHLQAYIDRFKAQATKARQAQSRIKQLERLQVAAPVLAESAFSFRFAEAGAMASPLIRLDDVAAGYGQQPILHKLRMSLEPGDRIGLLGPNGAGKSTLIQTLAGQLPPLAGQVIRDPRLRVGYFAQHQVDQLDLAASPLLHLQRLSPQATEQSLRNFLGGFQFHGDRVFEAVGPFSGGEKARLALALVVWQTPSLLLLDEPTNHLDLDMRQALADALQGFKGAVVLISHDRSLVASTCDELWRVDQGRVEAFDGDLDDYARWLTTRNSSAPASRPRPAPPSGGLRPLRERLRKTEARMDKLRSTLGTLEAQLADPALYEPARRTELAPLTGQRDALQTELAQLEESWIADAESLETFQET
ncbi:MAG: ABC-F family ATP-binding cassette domain-containing protein [Gammaproteobacteria bacterium]